MEKYDPKKIEPKWQKLWESKKFHVAKDFSKKEKYYSLMEFPYPSGDGLHTGHVRGYTAMDIVSRKRRMQGYNVLFPIGWDAFGLPTENYAIKTGRPPAEITKENTDTFRKQFKSLGMSFDWSREINTTDPKYYKWTQWIFLKLLEHGLAYKDKMLINWCPKCKIGLANEEVVAGECERCGAPVEKREKEQWMLAITKYADRLAKDLDEVDFWEKIKVQQRNWIGRSEGAEIEFSINPTPTLPKKEGEFGYHTTDPRTWRALQDRVLQMRKNSTQAEEMLWQLLRKNTTGCHFRRQHIIGRFVVDFVCLEKSLVVEIDGDIHDYQINEDKERTSFLEGNGFKVIRFRNDEVLDNTSLIAERIVSILKTLPLGEGKGGVIKVFTTRPDTIFGATYLVLSPEHSQIPNSKSQITNWKEVEKYIKQAKSKTEIDRTAEGREKTGVKLDGVTAINPATKEEIPVWVADYVLPHYGTGAIMAVPADDERDRQFAEKFDLPIVEVYKSAGFEEFGEKKTTYKLRDWVFSRQRYWGEPIPVIHCEICGIVPVLEKDLPVELPRVDKYEPTDTGESPLASITEWVNTKCPKCDGPAKRETDTMPNWAGSSWYYLAYLFDKQGFESPVSFENWKLQIENFRHFMPVDWYNGGMEHTTLHLLYSRFWNKFLYDIGAVPVSEPYKKRTSHGLILAEGGEKMSKSRGNVINPDNIVKRFGADTLRLYEMFMGPFDQAIAWSESSLVGPRRFLEKVWRLRGRTSDTDSRGPTSGDEVLMHKTIKKVTEDIESMGFNTAISSLMIFTNELDKREEISRQEYETLLLLLAPFAPHIAEELWHKLGNPVSKFIHLEPWPEYDPEKLAEEEIKMAVQIDGKVRGSLKVAKFISSKELEKTALAMPEVKKWLKGRKPKRVIVVLGKIVSIVTSG